MEAGSGIRYESITQTRKDYEKGSSPSRISLKRQEKETGGFQVLGSATISQIDSYYLQGFTEVLRLLVTIQRLKTSVALTMS